MQPSVPNQETDRHGRACARDRGSAGTHLALQIRARTHVGALGGFDDSRHRAPDERVACARVPHIYTGHLHGVAEATPLERLHHTARIGSVMQVLQAGSHKFLLLELDREFIENVARQAGFEFRFTEESRRVTLDLNAEGRQAPLLLFDAADPANLGWFSRCQFYVDGISGAVLQTPIQLANQRDRAGRALPNSVRIQINKELPASFRLPGKAPVTEQTVYSVLFNFLSALLNTGVGVCGGPVVQPLTGRIDPLGNRN
jgi:hypothetical protein